MEITQDQLHQIIPNNPYVEHWCKALNKLLPDYDIDTPARQAHQAAADLMIDVFDKIL